MKKIDIHMHLSLNNMDAVINGEHLASVDEMLPIMDKFNIEKSILMSSGEQNVLMDNKEVRSICRKYPDRFYYMATFDLSKKEDLEQRVLNEIKLGAKGIGELTYNIAFDDEDMILFLGILEKHNIPLLFHISPKIGSYYGVYDDVGLPKLENVLSKFPNLKFIAHSQPFWFEMELHENYNIEDRNGYPNGIIKSEGRVQELLRKYPNLYCDLSANSGGNAIMRDKEYGYKFIEEFKDRLLYGTDLFSINQYFPLGDYLDEAVEKRKISEDAYKMIVRDNAIKLFGL